MADVATQRQAIYDTAYRADDDLSVYTKMPGTGPNYPALLIRLGPATYTNIQERNGGQDVYEWELVMLVSGADMDVAQEALDAYLAHSGPVSIRQRFRENPTLGITTGAPTTAWIDRMEYGVTLSGEKESPDFGAIFKLKVRTTG